MIPLFLDPRPDELFYSVCARTQDAMRFDQKRSIGQYLFGNKQTTPVIDFPSRLGHVVDALPPGHNYTVDRLIDECTLLPFYTPFLPPHRVLPARFTISKIQPRRKGPLGSALQQYTLSGPLRFCPLCVQEERTQFGTCYWHRLHQVPCVIVCLVHLVMLEESTIPKHDIRRFISAEQAIKTVPFPRIFTEEPMRTQIVQLAEDVAWLLTHPNLMMGPDSLALRYHLILRDQGFSVSTSSVDWTRFCRVFEAYFSTELLRLFPRPLDVAVIIEWLQRIVWSAKYRVNPTYHFLLMQFLGYSSETFFHHDPEHKPFGNGPWPCLNPVCERFQQLVIQSADMVMSERRSSSVRGIFTCSCGFVYVRDGQDQSMDGHVDHITILLAGSRREQRFQRLCEEHRMMWLRVRQEFPTATRKELCRIARRAYNWLIKHDKDWLMAHQPEPIPSLENVEDWKQRDVEFARCLRESADYLLNRPTRPTHLTPDTIMRRLDAKGPYDTYKQHMPLTTQVLAELTETREAYTIRKIWWAAVQYQDMGKVPSRDQLRSLANMSWKEMPPPVERAIDAALEMLCQTVSSTSEK